MAIPRFMVRSLQCLNEKLKILKHIVPLFRYSGATGVFSSQRRDTGVKASGINRFVAASRLRAGRNLG
jgi:hypothetical protein